jgi:hypothetical protein
MMRHSGVAEEARPMVKTDSRIFFRNPLYDVRTQIKNVNTGDRFDALVKDISGSGMGLGTPREFPQGTGFGPLKLLGRVVWSKMADFSGARTGIVILNPRFMSVARILKLFF